VKHVPLHRFQEFLTPTPCEVEAIERAGRSRREFRRRQVISRQGEPVKEVYLLVDGWVAASMEVDSSRRQMVKIHLPGDFLGFPNIALARAAETMVALTAATIDVISLDALGRLFERAPRLAFTLFVSAQQERVMLMDHLAAVGQTSAIQRVSALLLHVYRRLKLVDDRAAEGFDWPLSQEHVAQGAALSAVHVNRTFAKLERLGLIARERRRMKLLDIPRLEEIAAFPDRLFVREPPWLTSIREEIPPDEIS
jgi:CRP/FNR family transcriptional regulator, anaerobic regulatory protein